MEDKNKIIPVVRVPNFTKYYATNIKAGLTDHDFRIEFMNEKINTGKDNWTLLSDSMVILSPKGSKRLFIEIKKLIETYEKENGVIEV